MCVCVIFEEEKKKKEEEEAKESGPFPLSCRFPEYVHTSHSAQTCIRDGGAWAFFPGPTMRAVFRDAARTMPAADVRVYLAAAAAPGSYRVIYLQSREFVAMQVQYWPGCASVRRGHIRENARARARARAAASSGTLTPQCNFRPDNPGARLSLLALMVFATTAARARARV